MLPGTSVLHFKRNKACGAPGSEKPRNPLDRLIRNGGGKQGRGNQAPYRQYGLDTEIQYRLRRLHGHAKASRILSEREAYMEFQYRPHIVDTYTIADVVFADAVSETSIGQRNVPTLDMRMTGFSRGKLNGQNDEGQQD